MQTDKLLRFFWGTAGIQIAGRALTIIFGIIVAKELGPKNFGLYSFVMSIIAIALIPATAGLPKLLIRDVASTQHNEQWGLLKGLIIWANAYAITISFVVIAVLLVVIQQQWIDQTTGGILFIALAMVPLKALLTIQSSTLSGLQYPSSAQIPLLILFPLTTLAILSIVLHLNESISLANVMQTQIVAGVIALSASAGLQLKKIPPAVTNVKAIFTIGKWQKSLAPFSLLMIVSTINTEMTSIFLGSLASKESVGHFRVAAQAAGLLAIGLQSINLIISPLITQLFKDNKSVELQKLITNSVRLSCLVTIPPALIFIIFGENIISIIFGVDYLPSALPLSILCLGQIVNVVSGSSGTILNATFNEKKSLIGVFSSMIITASLLPFLIESHQEIGAAIAVSCGLIYLNAHLTLSLYLKTKLVSWIR
ncbi:MAG: O-antigen/teichoic acid export membrane protein [Oceanicoccus sp.]